MVGEARGRLIGGVWGALRSPPRKTQLSKYEQTELGNIITASGRSLGVQLVPTKAQANVKSNAGNSNMTNDDLKKASTKIRRPGVLLVSHMQMVKNLVTSEDINGSTNKMD